MSINPTFVGIWWMQTISSALDSMGDMELCPSLDTDINLIGCIHSMFPAYMKELLISKIIQASQI